MPAQDDVCPQCNGAGYFRQDVPVGHSDFGKLVKCLNPFHNEDRLERLSRLSGLNHQELKRRLADIKRVHQGEMSNIKMLDAAQSMIDNPKGWLFIWGGPGNAKSEVLISIVNELNERNRGPAIYNKFANLVDYMRDAYSDNSRFSYRERFQQMLSAPVLAIDELDKARETGLAEEFRGNFLDERYRQALAGESVTIFASNVEPKQYPDFLYDRFRDGRFKIVHNTAGSARPFMR